MGVGGGALLMTLFPLYTPPPPPPPRWSNLKKRVALGKQRIGPRIQASGTTITQDLRTFGDTFGALHGDFCSSRCVLADCPVQEARSSIDHFERQLSTLKLQARDLIELQELLETNVFNFSRLKECVLWSTFC